MPCTKNLMVFKKLEAKPIFRPIPDIRWISEISGRRNQGVASSIFVTALKNYFKKLSSNYNLHSL